MTYKEFLNKLSFYKNAFTLVPSGFADNTHIRTSRMFISPNVDPQDYPNLPTCRLCPIQYLAFMEKGVKLDYIGAGQALGLDLNTIRRIATAADWYKSSLRNDLITALSLL